MVVFINDERYFKWLLKIAGIQTEYKIYKKLINKLHNTSFYFDSDTFIINRDSSREDDGLALRDDFIQDTKTNITRIRGECSVLEMLIGLSRRMDDICNYSLDSKINTYFFLLLRNLNLLKYNDENFNDEEISKILNIFMNRKYDKFGNGSLFPINNKLLKIDIRKLDIYAQMLNYLNIHRWRV